MTTKEIEFCVAGNPMAIISIKTGQKYILMGPNPMAKMTAQQILNKATGANLPEPMPTVADLVTFEVGILTIKDERPIITDSFFVDVDTLLTGYKTEY